MVVSRLMLGIRRARKTTSSAYGGIKHRFEGQPWHRAIRFALCVIAFDAIFAGSTDISVLYSLDVCINGTVHFL